ncbi:MAG: PEP-CTERM sorting domain-containing protein [Desulfobacula sp.]|nr:PEP-CTERM sorting domain-containing protein [Desulfobacula sp.]
MRKLLLGILIGVFLIAPFYLQTANATILFQDGFETAWQGDYAPGWINAAYRHGEAPVGKMMQQTTTKYSGNYGLQLTAASTPESWMWWAAVEVENLQSSSLDKKYDPWVSAMYYDDGQAGRTGQVYAVPDWVNPYINGSEDWTDVQFGARFNQPTTSNYYYVATGENSPGWENTGVQRTVGWHELKFQLSSSTGAIDFYIDTVLVGSSYRNDYTNLGTAIGLYTMFQNPLSNWSQALPYTIWDDFKVGSSVPEPTTMLLFGLGLLGVAGIGRRK